jgi:uncharacterized membrane protein (DUF2068 family)
VSRQGGEVAPVRHHGGILAVAAFAAAKGLLVFGVGVAFAVLVARGESARDMADWLVEHLHMDREGQAAAWFLEWSDQVTLQGWLVFFGFMLLYFAIQSTQAIGLWFEKRWAEWLTALSAGIYLPLEIMQLCRKPGWVCAAIMAVNLAVVGYMGWMLWMGRKK